MIAVYSTADAVLKMMAEKQASGADDQALGVGSLGELVDVFKRLIDGSTKTGKMTFYTHGAAEQYAPYDLVENRGPMIWRGSTKGTTFGRCLGQQTITTTGLPTRTSPRSCYPVAGLFEPRP
jgi:hypothetical protein